MISNKNYFSLKSQYRREQANEKNIKRTKESIVKAELIIHSHCKNEIQRIEINYQVGMLGIYKASLSTYYWQKASYIRWRNSSILG